MNSNGEAKIEDILEEYIAFYKGRLDENLPVDRKSCRFTLESLKDKKMIRQNMLTNPFEKYERKRFMYYSKELGMIALNHALLERLTKAEIEQIKEQFAEHLEEYYKELGGLQEHKLLEKKAPHS